MLPPGGRLPFPKPILSGLAGLLGKEPQGGPQTSKAALALTP